MYKDLVKSKDNFEYDNLQGDKNNKSNTLLKIVIFLILLQLIRMIMKHGVFIYIQPNQFNYNLTSMIVMIILTLLIIYKSKRENISLNVFSYMNTSESKFYYVIVTGAIILLIFTSSSFTFQISIDSLIPLIYTTVVIPVYEEIIFRSYIWEKLKEEYDSELKIYLVTTVLFSLWHIGYIDIMVNVSGTSNIGLILFIKCSLMLSYGIFIGFFKYKIKNSYSSMLIHSFINIFGR